VIVRDQGRSVTACDSCAGTEKDGAVLGRKATRRSLLCSDCEAEATRVPHPIAKPVTRARYRAALRHREKSGQLDLVDMVVPPP
jgi:hypothetical protein